MRPSGVGVHFAAAMRRTRASLAREAGADAGWLPARRPSDLVARAVAQKLATSFGQPVVVENRPGAGGVIATEQVAKAPADGYTLIHGTIGGIAVAMSLDPNRGYDTLRDLAPITQNVTVTNISDDAPFGAGAQREGFARPRPRKARGSQLRLFRFGHGDASRGGIAEASRQGRYHPRIVQGQRALAYGAPLGRSRPFLREQPHHAAAHQVGRVRALAVTGAKRSRLLPDLPTVAEAGLPGYAASGWYGLLAPAGTPTAVITRLHAETAKALRLPDVSERLSSQGAEPVGSTPEELTRFIRSEIEKWSGLVKVARMKPE